MSNFQFSEYAPDRSHLDASVAPVVKNVVPTANGYAPFLALQPYSEALSGVCRGAYLARAFDGTFNIVAGTATTLEISTGTSWTDVTRATGGDYNLATGHSWSIRQFRDVVAAANVNDAIQSYTLGSSSKFAALSADAPMLKYLWVESGYLGGAQTSSNPNIMYRSAYQDPTGWTAGINGSTSQVFPDGGPVQGASTNDQGAVVFSENKSRALINRPGQQVGFQLTDIEKTRGVVAPLSIVDAGGSVYFLSHDGFYRFGNPSTPIGLERINRTFLDDIDHGYINAVQGAHDPARPMVWWRYKSSDNASTAYTDKLIGYHYQLDRWCYAEVNLEWMLGIQTPGYTLETLVTSLGFTSIESIPFSLDSPVYAGGAPAFAGFDTDHKLGFFQGDALEAVLETADIPIGGEGLRGFVNGFRLVGDVSNAYGQVISKANFGATTSIETTEQQMQSGTGMIHGRANGRTVRFRTRIPAAEAWTNAQGIEIPQAHMRASGRR